MRVSAAKREEDAVVKSSKLSRERVREWLRQEIDQHRPPPNPTEIRSQLGWSLVEFEYDDRRSLDFPAHLIT
jgi:hypothetical protein